MEQGLLVSCLDADDLPEALRLTADIGYRHCEISVCPDDARPNLASLDDAGRRGAVALAADLGMTVSAVQCHIHNGYADASPEVRETAVDHTRRMIDLCADLEIPILHIVSGVAEDDAPHDTKLNRTALACAAILDHAAGGPVRIGLEPVFIYVVGNLAHTRRLLDKLESRPDLCINYDPSHFPFHDEPTAPFVQAMRTRVIHAHSKDARVGPVTATTRPDQDNRWAMPGDRYFQFVAPGQGDIDWREALSDLRSAGYDDVLSLEMGHGYEGRPRDVARSTYAYFKNEHGLA